MKLRPADEARLDSLADAARAVVEADATLHADPTVRGAARALRGVFGALRRVGEVWHVDRPQRAAPGRVWLLKGEE